MKTSENLIKAKALIVNPDKWVKENFSLYSDCFCALGAIAFAEANEKWDDCTFVKDWMSNKPENFLRKAVELENSRESFAAYNDSHTHEQVMTAFDKAIQLALEEESKDAN